MKIKIHKGIANGEVLAPASKSMAHRLLIAAAMCDGESTVRRVPECEDVLATVDCLRSMGVKITRCGEDMRVRGINFASASPTSPLLCRESGSTLRFMIPLALLSGNSVTLRGAARLLERPLSVYEDIAKNRGLTLSRANGEIKVMGPLSAGEYSLPGNVSSQFITGLMLALPTLPDDSRIIITTGLESRSYVELTRAALAAFGVEIVWESEQTLYVRGGQKYIPSDVTVEGDYSGAAFLLALNHLGASVRVEGLLPDSLQGDRVADELFYSIRRGSAVIDISDCPDLGPILFAVAAALGGATFVGTKRLQIKESDRAAVMAEELSKFGVKLTLSDNSVTVAGGELHTPKEELCAHNDHRIVMSLAVLATLTGGVIDGAEAISKSYPDFFSDLSRLGIRCETVE